MTNVYATVPIPESLKVSQIKGDNISNNNNIFEERGVVHSPICIQKLAFKNVCIDRVHAYWTHFKVCVGKFKMTCKTKKKSKYTTRSIIIL